MPGCPTILILACLWLMSITVVNSSNLNQSESNVGMRVAEETMNLIQATFTVSGGEPENDWIPPLLEPRRSVKGGSVALSKEFPHMALIGYGDRERISWQCGGTLISKRYVLSAAHCTYLNGEMNSAKWVRLGELNLASEEDDAEPEDFSIIERINHPDYKPPLVYNDIALYKLEKDVSFNNYIYPICLHRYARENFTNGIVTGWGRLGVAEPRSPHLRKAKVSFFKHKDCAELIPRSSQLPQGVNRRTQICAGDIEGNRDTCQGDSGGPLSAGDRGGIDCRHNQVGITSFGRVCGTENSPGVYTKVAYFVSWIDSVITES